jgi:hypothetical protein
VDGYLGYFGCGRLKLPFPTVDVCVYGTALAGAEEIDGAFGVVNYVGGGPHRSGTFTFPRGGGRPVNSGGGFRKY